MYQYMKQIFKKKSFLFLVVLVVVVLGLLVNYFAKPGELATDLQSLKELGSTPDVTSNVVGKGPSLDSRILAQLGINQELPGFGSGSKTIMGGGTQQSQQGGTPCLANQLPSASASPSTANVTDFKKPITFTLNLNMPAQKSDCMANPAVVLLDPTNKDITSNAGISADNYTNYATVDMNNVQQNKDTGVFTAPISLNLSSLASVLKTNGNYTLKIVSGNVTMGSMVFNVTANITCTYPSLAFSPATAVAVSDFTKTATLTLNNTLPDKSCLTGVLVDPAAHDITSSFNGGLAVTADASTAVQTVKANAKQLTLNFTNYQTNTFTSNGTYTFKLMKADGKTLLASIPLTVTALPCSNLTEKLSASTLAITDFTKATSALTLTPAISSKCNLSATLVNAKKSDVSSNFNMSQVSTLNGTSLTFDATKLTALSTQLGGGSFTFNLINGSDSNKVLATVTLTTPVCTGLSFTNTPTSLTYTDFTKAQTITLNNALPNAICTLVPKLFDGQGNDISSNVSAFSGLSNFLSSVGSTGSVAQFVKNQTKQLSIDFSSYGKSSNAKDAQVTLKLLNPNDNNAVVATLPLTLAGLKVKGCANFAASFTDLATKGAKASSSLTLLSSKADKNGLSTLFSMVLPYGQCSVGQTITDPAGTDITSYVLSQPNIQNVMVKNQDGSNQINFTIFRTTLPKVSGKYKTGNYVSKFYNLDDGNKLLATLTLTVSN